MRRLLKSLLLLMALAVDGQCAEPPITSLAFSPDGQTLLATSQAGVQLRDWPSLKLRQTISCSSPNLNDIAFSPDGSSFAVGGGSPAVDGIVEVFSWPQAVSQSVLRPNSDSIASVTWIDDTMLAAASLDHQVVIANAQSSEVIHRIDGHSRGVLAVAALASSHQIVTVGIDFSLRVWDAKQGSLVHGLSIHTAPVTRLALRPGDHALPMIASASEDRTARLWQPTIGRMVRFVRLESVPIDIEWTSDGSQLIAACADGHLRVIDPDSVEVTNDLAVSDDWIYALAVNPSGEAVVTGDAKGTVKHISIETILGRFNENSSADSDAEVIK
ncbi:MAG: hypothetical protein WBD20_03555 [Pirellulaceae bacterium]